MSRKPIVWGTSALSILLGAFSANAIAGVSAADAAKLGKEFTPIGAIAGPNADGSIPKWEGEAAFTDEQKALTRKDLQRLKKEIKSDPKAFDRMVGEQADEPLFEISAANMAEYSDQLTEGHKALIKKYPGTYKMKVYKTHRPAFFPQKIYDETIKNATRASLKGTDSVQGAALGFPFPIPSSGAEVIWNHKLKYRGSAVRRFNNQIVVKTDGTYNLTKIVEDVKFKYANLNDKKKSSDSGIKLLAYYLAEVKEPPRLAGQLTLVHETADQVSGGRQAWIYSPGTGRVNRAPKVGYDNPSIGTDGEQFNDQVDVFNGALDRYTWKLIGRKEMYIAYNSYAINSPLLKYADLVRKGHVNPEHPRYERHRVWVVEATLKSGVSHQLKKRRFYVDEDSWSIAAVDGYDNRDQLWKFQESYLITFPFVPTTTGAPELIADLQSGRYFVTALTNEDRISDFEVKFKDREFKPAALKRRIK